MATALARRTGIHYGWVVTVVTFLVLLTAAGVRSMPGVLVVPLEQEFGWSRAIVPTAVSINLLLYGLVGPFSAALMERFGVRRVMLGSLCTVAAAIGLTTRMSEPWQLDLLWGVIVGLASGSLASVLGASVANRWFFRRRGLVIGILSASSGTGQLVFLPLLASLAVSIGWRTAALLVSVVAAVMVPLVFVLMRERPEDLGLRPFGAQPGDDPPGAARIGNPLKLALETLSMGLKKGDFWLLAGSFFVCGASTNGLIGTHLIPASMEHGIPEVTAAGLLALMGIFDLVGTTGSGWLSDRFDSRWLLAWYYSLRGISLVFLPFALGSAWFTLVFFAVFYGLDWLATVPPTIRLTADIFGRQRGAIAFGWIFAAHQLGAATAAAGAGVLRTVLGNYQAAFIGAGLLCFVAVALVIRIGRPARSNTAAPLELATSAAT